MQKVIRKLHHTNHGDNHKSTTVFGYNHVESCCDNLRFFEVLNADVTQKPKTNISDATS